MLMGRPFGSALLGKPQPWQGLAHCPSTFIKDQLRRNIAVVERLGLFIKLEMIFTIIFFWGSGDIFTGSEVNGGGGGGGAAKHFKVGLGLG